MGENQAEKRNRQRSRPERRQSDSKKIPFGDYTFLRIELTADEKEDCVSNYLDGINPRVVLADLSIPNYKLSFTWDDKGATCTASLSCTDSEDPNAAGIITAKGRGIVQALGVLGYKVLVLCDEKPWRQVEAERGGGYSEIG